MKALKVMADSLRTGYIHHTEVLNTLIELENTGGAFALQQFQEQLEHGYKALAARQHPSSRLAAAWLEATRCYIQEYGLDMYSHHVA